MFGAFLPGSSLTIFPTWGALSPVSAAWAGGDNNKAWPVITRTTANSSSRSLRIPDLPPSEQELIRRHGRAVRTVFLRLGKSMSRQSDRSGPVEDSMSKEWTSPSAAEDTVGGCQ